MDTKSWFGGSESEREIDIELTWVESGKPIKYSVRLGQDESEDAGFKGEELSTEDAQSLILTDPSQYSVRAEEVTWTASMLPGQSALHASGQHGSPAASPLHSISSWAFHHFSPLAIRDPQRVRK